MTQRGEIQQVSRRTSQPSLILRIPRPCQVRAHIDPEGAQRCRSGHQTLGDIFDVLMVMAMDHQLDAERLSEFVDRLPAVRVSCRWFVRHQDVDRLASQQLLEVVRENRGPVAPGDAVSPPLLAAHGPAQRVGRNECDFLERRTLFFRRTLFQRNI